MPKFDVQAMIEEDKCLQQVKKYISEQVEMLTAMHEIKYYPSIPKWLFGFHNQRS